MVLNTQKNTKKKNNTILSDSETDIIPRKVFKTRNSEDSHAIRKKRSGDEVNKISRESEIKRSNKPKNKELEYEEKKIFQEFAQENHKETSTKSKIAMDVKLNLEATKTVKIAKQSRSPRSKQSKTHKAKSAKGPKSVKEKLNNNNNNNNNNNELNKISNTEKDSTEIIIVEDSNNKNNQNNQQNGSKLYPYSILKTKNFTKRSTNINKIADKGVLFNELVIEIPKDLKEVPITYFIQSEIPSRLLPRSPRQVIIPNMESSSRSPSPPRSKVIAPLNVSNPPLRRKGAEIHHNSSLNLSFIDDAKLKQNSNRKSQNLTKKISKLFLSKPSSSSAVNSNALNSNSNGGGSGFYANANPSSNPNFNTIFANSPSSHSLSSSVSAESISAMSDNIIISENIDKPRSNLRSSTPLSNSNNNNNNNIIENNQDNIDEQTTKEIRREINLKKFKERFPEDKDTIRMPSPMSKKFVIPSKSSILMKEDEKFATDIDMKNTVEPSDSESEFTVSKHSKSLLRIPLRSSFTHSSNIAPILSSRYTNSASHLDNLIVKKNLGATDIDDSFMKNSSDSLYMGPKLSFSCDDLVNRSNLDDIQLIESSSKISQSADNLFSIDNEEKEEKLKAINNKQNKVSKDERKTVIENTDSNIIDILTPDIRVNLKNSIENHTLSLIDSDIYLTTISGPPHDELPQNYLDVLSSQTISTYPYLPGIGRAGDPICDYYYIRLFKDAAILSLADGCNWGESPKQAAKRASTCFVRYMQDHLHLCNSTREVANYLLNAVSAAHCAIVQGHNNDIWRAGTTTLIGGVLLPYDLPNTTFSLPLNSYPPVTRSKSLNNDSSKNKLKSSKDSKDKDKEKDNNNINSTSNNANNSNEKLSRSKGGIKSPRKLNFMKRRKENSGGSHSISKYLSIPLSPKRSTKTEGEEEYDEEYDQFISSPRVPRSESSQSSLNQFNIKGDKDQVSSIRNSNSDSNISKIHSPRSTKSNEEGKKKKKKKEKDKKLGKTLTLPLATYSPPVEVESFPSVPDVPIGSVGGDLHSPLNNNNNIINNSNNNSSNEIVNRTNSNDNNNDNNNNNNNDNNDNNRIVIERNTNSNENVSPMDDNNNNNNNNNNNRNDNNIENAKDNNNNNNNNNNNAALKKKNFCINDSMNIYNDNSGSSPQSYRLKPVLKSSPRVKLENPSTINYSNIIKIPISSSLSTESTKYFTTGGSNVLNNNNNNNNNNNEIIKETQNSFVNQVKNRFENNQTINRVNIPKIDPIKEIKEEKFEIKEGREEGKVLVKDVSQISLREKIKLFNSVQGATAEETSNISKKLFGKRFASFRKTTEFESAAMNTFLASSDNVILPNLSGSDNGNIEAIINWIDQSQITSKELESLEKLKSSSKMDLSPKLSTPNQSMNDDFGDKNDEFDSELEMKLDDIDFEIELDLQLEPEDEMELGVKKRKKENEEKEITKINKEIKTEEIDLAIANWIGASPVKDKKIKKSKIKKSKKKKKKKAEKEVKNNEVKQKERRRRKWALLFANVGDCKVYVCSKETKEIKDITKDNRLDADNAKDCGGRLGPYREGGTPDLRNLSLFYHTVYDGDIIIILSDGVHDNLDPEMLGLSPIDVLSCIKSKTEIEVVANQWSEMDKEQRNQTKTSFRESQLATIIGDKFDTISCTQINQLLMNYCRNITVRSRMFMEQNPFIELPDDYNLFPGKMDHSTCICFKVGEVKSETGPKKSLSNSEMPSIQSSPMIKLKKKITDPFA